MTAGPPVSAAGRRDLALLAVAVAVSVLGDGLALVVLTIRVHDQTRAGWAVAALLLAGTLPTIVLAPVVGLLADRVETVRLLVVTAMAQAAVAGALAFAASLPLTLLLAFALGVGAAVSFPALFTLPPEVAGEAGIVRANAWIEVARYTGMTAGPALGGLLAATLGVRGALLADAASFVVFAAATGLLRVRRSPRPGPATPREARRGLAAIAGDRVLAAGVGLVTALVLFGGATNVAEVFLVKDVFGAGDAGFGALTAAWAAGIVTGATLGARRVAASRLIVALLAGASVAGLATLVAGVAPTLVVAVVAYAVGGVGNAVGNIAMRSLLHHRVPAPLRGRAGAGYAAVASSAQVAALLLGGGLVATAGPRGTLVIDGAGMLVATGATAILTASSSQSAADLGRDALPSDHHE